MLGAKARALTNGRYHVSFEDIRAMAHPVLRHRVLTNFRAESEGITTDSIIDELLTACRCRSRDVDARQAGRSRDRSNVVTRPGYRRSSRRHMQIAKRCPARGSSIRRSWRGSATSSCSRATVVDGFINGLHRAPFFGASIDFAEHRGYVAGDDIRRVDWRLYARTDRYYVKQYEADTNTNFSMLLDISKSMRFASGGVSKLEYGCYLGACLAYLAQRQRDRVGIITFDSDIVTHVPPSAKHFDVRAAHARSREGRAAGQPARRR